jgi:hypothetical protein
MILLDELKAVPLMSTASAVTVVTAGTTTSPSVETSCSIDVAAQSNAVVVSTPENLLIPPVEVVEVSRVKTAGSGSEPVCFL